MVVSSGFNALSKYKIHFSLAGIVSGQYPLEEMSGGPLSQMSEAVNNIDKIKSEDGTGNSSNGTGNGSGINGNSTNAKVN